MATRLSVELWQHVGDHLIPISSQLDPGSFCALASLSLTCRYIREIAYRSLYHTAIMAEQRRPQSLLLMKTLLLDGLSTSPRCLPHVCTCIVKVHPYSPWINHIIALIDAMPLLRNICYECFISTASADKTAYQLMVRRNIAPCLQPYPSHTSTTFIPQLKRLVTNCPGMGLGMLVSRQLVDFALASVDCNQEVWTRAFTYWLPRLRASPTSLSRLVRLYLEYTYMTAEDTALLLPLLSEASPSLTYLEINSASSHEEATARLNVRIRASRIFAYLFT